MTLTRLALPGYCVRSRGSFLEVLELHLVSLVPSINPFWSHLSECSRQSSAGSNLITKLTSRQNLALSQRERERDGRKQGTLNVPFVFSLATTTLTAAI